LFKVAQGEGLVSDGQLSRLRLQAGKFMRCECVAQTSDGFCSEGASERGRGEENIGASERGKRVILSMERGIKCTKVLCVLRSIFFFRKATRGPLVFQGD
jgi:hypothetical protein